jgi:hypothetical protein
MSRSGVYRAWPGTRPAGVGPGAGEVDDVEHWLKTEEAAEAMRQDGVRPETLVILTEQ